MELVFDMVSAQQFAPGLISSKTFKQAGGIIGRAEDCDWVIPDRKRVLSSRHAEVSYRDGAFFLTDTSSNGIQLKDTGASLGKGRAHAGVPELLRLSVGRFRFGGVLEARGAPQPE